MGLEYLKNTQKTIFCFYGNTQDCFVDETLYPLDFYHVLFRELKTTGYERILFYRGNGIEFLDSASKALWYGRTEPEEVLMPPGCEDLLEETEHASDISPINCSDMELLRYIAVFMEDVEIKTAIIIGRGTEMMRRFSSSENVNILTDTLSGMTQYHQERLNNRNCLIFLFDRFGGETEDFDSLLEKNRDKHWTSYFRKGRSVNYVFEHVIRCPNREEVRCMLNYLRLYGCDGRKLRLTVNEIEKISSMLSLRLSNNLSNGISNEKNLRVFNGKSLCDLMKYLIDEFVQKDLELNMAMCRSICKDAATVSAMERLDLMIGMRELKETMHRLIDARKNYEAPPSPPPSRLAAWPVSANQENKTNIHFVLTGKPGTGKTTVARLLGEILCENGYLTSGHLVERKGTDLKGEYVGHSGANTRRAVEDALGGVLFIDEAYGLISTEDDDINVQDQFSQDVVNTLLPAMTNYEGEFSLIMAGYPDKIEKLLQSNDGWKSRFDNNIIHIEDYTPCELNQIFHRMLSDYGIKISEALEEHLPVFFENWYYNNTGNPNWGNAREVKNLVGRLKNKCGTRPVFLEDIPKELQRFWDESNIIDIACVAESMIGQEKVKALFKNMANKMEFDTKVVHEIPQMLFVGNPGTGKTTMAEYMGGMLKKYDVLKSDRVVAVLGRKLISTYIGKTAERTENMLLSAKDGVLFIDEAYELLDSANGKEAIELLMDYSESQHLKEFPVCIILAGYSDKMEELRKTNYGLYRRFSTKIEFEPYTVEQLVEIFKLQIERKKFQCDNAFFTAAQNNFEQNAALIAELYNADYPRLYLNEAEKGHWNNLEKKYKKSEFVPEHERYLLTGEDAPSGQWRPD